MMVIWNAENRDTMDGVGFTVEINKYFACIRERSMERPLMDLIYSIYSFNFKSFTFLFYILFELNKLKLNKLVSRSQVLWWFKGLHKIWVHFFKLENFKIISIQSLNSNYFQTPFSKVKCKPDVKKVVSLFHGLSNGILDIISPYSIYNTTSFFILISSTLLSLVRRVNSFILW